MNNQITEGGDVVYKKVTKKEDDRTFRQIWGDFCEEKNIPYVDKNQHSSRYLLLDQKCKSIGTIEYVLYQEKEQSNIENYYPFSQSFMLNGIKDKRIYEVSKMCLSRDSRGKGYFKNIMLTIYTYAVKNDIDWFIAVMTYRMYLFARTMGFQVVEVDRPFWLSKQAKVVPVMLNVKHAIEHMKTFKEFQHYCENVKRAANSS